MPANAPLLDVWMAVIPTVQGLAQNVTSQINSSQGQQATHSAGLAMGGSIVAGIMAFEGFKKLGEFVSEQFKGAMEQQGANAKLSASLNLSVEETKKATDATKKLWTQGYGETYDEVAETMKLIVGSVDGARDMNSDQLAKMGKDITNLSGAYGVSGEQIAQTVQSMIGTGLAKDWDEAVSVILGGYQTLGASGEDWAESLNEFSDDFVQLGITGPQALQLVNAAVKAGIKDTDAFVDGIQEMGIKIADGTADDSLSALGLDPNQVRKNMKAGGDVASKQFGEIIDKLKKSGDRANWAGVFGTKSEDYFNAFQNFDMSKFNEQLPEGTGNLEKFDKAMNDNAESSMKAFKNSVSQAFIDTLIPVLEWATPLLEKFTKFIQENKGAAIALSVAVGVGMVGAIIAATAALWGMAAPVLANPLTWIILGIVAALALVGLAVYTIVKNWDSSMKSLGEIWGGFTGWLGDTFTSIGQWFVGLGTNIANFFIGVVNTPIKAINWMIKALNGVKFTLPDWLGGYHWDGLHIPLLGEIPAFAEGGVVQPTNGGAVIKVAEAGKPEAISDAGKLNRLIDNTANMAANGADSGTNIHIDNVTLQADKDYDITQLFNDLLEEANYQGQIG